MTAKRIVMLGMLVLAALTGCTTGGAFFATDPNYATDAAQASPGSYTDGAARCESDGGWYDRAAGVCDRGGA